VVRLRTRHRELRHNMARRSGAQHCKLVPPLLYPACSIDFLLFLLFFTFVKNNDSALAASAASCLADWQLAELPHANYPDALGHPHATTQRAILSVQNATAGNQHPIVSRSLGIGPTLTLILQELHLLHQRVDLLPLSFLSL
jgi:hypothetical protein